MAEIIVVHGTPGSGKSTQAERLARLSFDDRQIVHIPAGDRLRDIRTGRVESWLKHKVGRPGVLLNHEIVNAIVFEHILQFPSASIVLVDGYPRFIEAVSLFMDSIESANDKLLGCINLSISEETCVSRLLLRGQRPGEKTVTKEFIESRYREHLDHTMASVRALEELAPLINVDAEPPVDVVWASICLAFMRLAI